MIPAPITATSYRRSDIPEPSAAASRSFAEGAAGRPPEVKFGNGVALADANPMFEKVFVAFDGTPESRRACEIAIEIAARFHSAITIGTVHAASKEPSDGHLESLAPFDSEGKSLAILIEEFQAAAHAKGVKSLEPAFLQGEVVPALLKFLSEHPHDLAVAGSRGLSRGRRIILGSVSTGLVSEAPCPVLVVRGRRANSSARATPPPP
jgi:nucleotide-binding universal stress UspA family protein